jgi:hypothetical protein
MRLCDAAKAAVIVMFAGAGVAQNDATRQIWNTEFLQKRPAGKSKSPPPVTYRPSAALPVPAEENRNKVLVGVTLWRLRPPRTAEREGVRLLVLDQKGAQQGEQTPERIDTATPLADGDLVRLSVEAPTAGYLHVIDREQYADGTLSDPYLIYPNWQTRRGDNVLAAGRLIEIPDQRNSPNSFTIRASRPDQVGELLTLLVSPAPLFDEQINRDPLKLDLAVYTEWEKKWAVNAQLFELSGAIGKAWTDREKIVGADHRVTLTQDDPLPQTLYGVSVKPGEAFLIKVRLHMKR